MKLAQWTEWLEQLALDGCIVEQGPAGERCRFVIDSQADRGDLVSIQNALVCNPFWRPIYVLAEMDDAPEQRVSIRKGSLGAPIPEPELRHGQFTRVEQLARWAYAESPVVAARFQAWEGKQPWKNVNDVQQRLAFQRDLWLYIMGDAETEFVREIDRLVEGAFGRCESPIEELFLAAMSAGHGGHGLWRWNIRDNQVGCFHHMLYEDELNGFKATVHSQYEAHGYRLDFALFSADKRVAVELDGHEFHERTREQAEHDKKRDRVLQLNGWTVLRFTGSQVWRDPHACVREVLTAFPTKEAPF